MISKKVWNVSFVWLVGVIICLMVSPQPVSATASVEKHGNCNRQTKWYLKITSLGTQIRVNFRGDSPSSTAQNWKVVAHNNKKKIFDSSVTTQEIDDIRRLRNKYYYNNYNNYNNRINDLDDFVDDYTNDDDDDFVESDDNLDEGVHFVASFTTANLNGNDVISIKATASKTKEICQTNIIYSW